MTDYSKDTYKKPHAEREGEEMRQRELLEFRTPQHPSSGTNNWGGASPLLARNLPNVSLEQRYERLNTIRTRDEIFPAHEEDSVFFPQTQAKKHECPPTPSRRGFLAKLIMWSPRKEKSARGSGTKKKKRWLPRWNPENRWPQGWC